MFKVDQGRANGEKDFEKNLHSVRVKVKVCDHAKDEVCKYNNALMTRTRITTQLAKLMTYCRDSTE